MLRDVLPTTASGRFRFMLVVCLVVLAVIVLALWLPALAPKTLGGLTY